MGKVRSHWHKKWRWQRVTKLMARDGLSCQICGESLDRHIKDFLSPNYITFDHITPRSSGGGEGLENIRLAHRLCNNLRGNDPILPEDEELQE